jgi:hypothetical protein
MSVMEARGKAFPETISRRRELLLLGVIVTFAQLTWAQQSNTVTITEPAVITLANLYKQADIVALVKVVSGDTENYTITVYKAEVTKSFKGAAAGETIYFGPYTGERLGSEDILFLRRVSQPIGPKSTSSFNYGTIHYSEVFKEGYSSMMTSYECNFAGKTIGERCDYGVRVCTDYITLPKSTPTAPPMTDDPPFGCRWIRKQAFISLLEKLTDPKK